MTRINIKLPSRIRNRIINDMNNVVNYNLYMKIKKLRYDSGPQINTLIKFMNGSNDFQ